MLKSTEHEIPTAFFNNNKSLKIKTILTVKLTDVVLVLLLNVKMATIFSISTLTNMLNFMFSLFEY